MDENRIKGAARQVTGTIKEAVGKEQLEAEGRADKLTGQAQGKVGEVKDKVRDKLKK